MLGGKVRLLYGFTVPASDVLDREWRIRDIKCRRWHFYEIC